MRLLLGGSPCTYWSIAQTKNRETEPSGIGWELFKNYLIALEKFQPDYFLYENNSSMAKSIKAQITKELGVEPIEINSALVSAQSRKRLYWANIPGVERPEDKGILLRDILETGVVWREKGYTLRASIGQHGGTSSVLKTIMYPGKFTFNGVAEPVRISTIESGAKNTDFDSQQYRVYSPDGKSVTLCGQGGGVGAKTGLYAVPYDCDVIITDNSIRCQRRNKKHSTVQSSHVNFDDAKSQTLSPSHVPMVIEAAGVKTYPVYEVRDGKITIKGKQYPIKLVDGFYIIRKLTVLECKRL